MYTHIYIKKYLSQPYTARGNIRSFASILSMKVNQNIHKSFIQKQHQIVLMYSCSIGAELFILIHIQPTRLLLYITCINYILYNINTNMYFHMDYVHNYEHVIFQKYIHEYVILNDLFI